MVDKLHLELVKFEEELSKLKSAVDYIESAKATTEAAMTVIKNVLDLKIEFENFAEQTKLLIAKIDKVDFPSRLDKLDATVAAINTNISNLQTRIESVERNIKDDIKSNTKELSTKLDNKFAAMMEQFVLQTKKLNLIKWIFISGLFLLVVGLVFTIIK